MKHPTRHFILPALLGVLLLSPLQSVLWAETTIRINNVDPPREGLNDSTPVAAIGGNDGATLGAQRLNVFRFAADVWASILDSPVEIVVQATFSPLPCDMTSAVLGAAGPVRLFANFQADPSIAEERHADVWYPAALSNALAGQDLSPGPLDPELLGEPYNDDIVAFFNGDIDGNPNCLPGDWYYGFDNPAPKGTISLLNVVMHELAHGLGIVNFSDPTTGAFPLDLPDIHSMSALDTSVQKHWHEMTNDERLTSQVKQSNQGNLVWDGESVTREAPDFLAFQTELEVLSPVDLQDVYEVRLASFGPAPRGDADAKVVELANDRIGDPTDACEPLKNKFKRKIALVRRGNCPFLVKTRHAQAVGASAVLVMNSVSGEPPLLDGASDGLYIPTVSIEMEFGTALKEQIQNARGAGVKAILRVNAQQLVGADEQGRVALYAPPAFEVGSSISHWDVRARPNLLMEPFLTQDLDAANEVDLTRFQLQDMGWALVEEVEEVEEGAEEEAEDGGGEEG